ncbi:MAG: DUF2807 domain-containing protein [Oscillospiraceae bacterium]|nr:DUF2807 domain-containing protein [Oscillospiraceae bacterium]
MKKRSFFWIDLTAVILLLLAACTWFSWSGRLSRSGPPQGLEFTAEGAKALPAFHALQVSGLADITLHTGTEGEYRAVLRGGSNAENLRISVRGGTLHIANRRGTWFWPSSVKHTIDIYCPEIKDISLSGAGNIYLEKTAKAAGFTAHISGAGTIQGEVDCERLKVSLSGAGSFKISGQCAQADISLSGAGAFEGKELVAQDARVSVSGVGSVYIYTEKTLDARLSGVGNINYGGNPRITEKKSGLGTLKPF